MIFILFQICIVLGDKRIRTKDPLIHTNFMQKAEIKITNHQKRIIPLNISDIYDIDVFKITDGKSGEAVREPILSLDDDDLEEIQIENNCIGLPRHPYMKQVADHQILEVDDNAYYTDMLAVRDNNFIYLVSDQLVLTQIELKNISDWTFETKVQKLDIKKLLNIDIDYSNGLFSCDENSKQCLLITTVGAYWFDKHQDFDYASTTFIKDESYINRKQMNDIYYDSDYLVVAAGKDGVDIYKNSQQQQVSFFQPQLQYLYTINAKQMNSQSVNVISVKILSGRLSILDEINGLHIFQLFPLEKPVLLMQIRIPRVFAFEQSLNTYLIMAETPNNIEYMMELFVDLVKLEYYVNRVFVDDFTFNDIEIMDNYAIIIGEDVHMVIRHSIFNGFIQENKELIRYFEQQDLLRLDRYRAIYEKDSKLKQSEYYIGVSKFGLHVWKYSEIAPTLICEYNYGVDQWFKVQFNSTLCPQQQVTTPFEQCTNIQEVHLIVDGPLLESDSIYVVIISVSCGLVLVEIDLVCSVSNYDNNVEKREIVLCQNQVIKKESNRSQKVWSILRGRIIDECWLIYYIYKQMKSIIILASLVLVVISKRIRVKQSYTYNNSNENNKLKFSAQQKIITMLNVSDVYDVDVLQMENGAVKQVVETPYISLDNEYLDEYKIDNECIGLPKHPKLFEVFEHDILEQTEDMYYTDILPLPQLEIVFLITDNLLLMQGTLSKNGSEWSFLMKNNSVQLRPNLTSYANAQFCCYEQRCLIITNLGGFQINVTADMDNNETIFIEEPQIVKRSEFYTLSNFESDLAVAAGTQGVDIYSFDQDSFKLTFTLTVTDFRTKQINIISLKLSRGRLSVLDEYNGLFIFDFKKNQKPTLLTFVPIPRSVAFDHYQDTYLVVAQTPNNIEYMMELFVNLSNDDYYINRVYVDDFSFKDIEINEHYAIVIGEDVHMVIRHSIFNGFLKNNKELIKTFFQNELIRFEHYDLPKESSDNHKFNEISYYIGLSKGSIHIWRLLEYNAVIICQFQNGGTKDYVLRSNSTLCPNRTTNEVYEQCTTTQQLNVQVSGSLIESDQLSLIIGLSVAGGVILLGVILFLCKKGRAMLKRVQVLRKQAQEMKKYGHFQEVEQDSIAK